MLNIMNFDVSIDNNCCLNLNNIDGGRLHRSVVYFSKHKLTAPSTAAKKASTRICFVTDANYSVILSIENKYINLFVNFEQI